MYKSIQIMGLGQTEADTCLCDPECHGDQETLTLHTADYLQHECEHDSKEDSEENAEDEEEDDDDDEEDGDIEDITVKGRPFHLPTCLQSRPCAVCLYLFIVLVLLSSLVALIVIGLLVVAPYQKASSFVPATCHPVQGSVDGEDRRCSCGKGCNSKYPCLKLTVLYTGTDSKQHVAALSQDESTLHRQCSYYPPCKSSRNENKESVRQYALQYGNPAHNYSCLFNPENAAEVIRARRFQLHQVVHGMLWSAVIFSASLGLLLIAVKRRGCEFL